jgi:hypothetical protein
MSHMMALVGPPFRAERAGRKPGVAEEKFRAKARPYSGNLER